MSVYIKGMEMPTEATIITIYKLKGQFYASAHGTELCPLVPIPEHGRLIDADALEDFVIALKRDAIHAYEWTGKSGEWNTRISERERFAVTIEDAPTIILADKEGYNG